MPPPTPARPTCCLPTMPCPARRSCCDFSSMLASKHPWFAFAFSATGLTPGRWWLPGRKWRLDKVMFDCASLVPNTLLETEHFREGCVSSHCMATAASDSGALVRQALAMPAAVYNAFMRATALLLPVMLFVPAVCRHPNGVLWAGMGVQGAGALVLCARWQDGRRLPMQGVLALYLLVLLWLWPAALVFRDSYLSLAVGLALVIVLLTAALVLV